MEASRLHPNLVAFTRYGRLNILKKDNSDNQKIPNILAAAANISQVLTGKQKNQEEDNAVRTKLISSLPAIIVSLQRAANTDPKFEAKFNNFLAKMTRKDPSTLSYPTDPNQLLSMVPMLNSALLQADEKFISELRDQLIILLPDLKPMFQ